ncbi:MAG: NACHT domain-containing protein, partial [Bacteroidota bacterium]
MQRPPFMICVAEAERACIKSKLTPLDKKALRYCILRQLGMLSLHAQDSSVRVRSIDKLQELGKSWSDDRDIEEELKFMLLDGLGTISQQSVHNTDKIRAKNILESWLIPLESTSTASTPRVLLSALDPGNLDLAGGISSRKAAAALCRIETLPSVSQSMLQWLSSTPSGTPRDQIACTDRLRERLSCKLNTFTKRSEVPPVLGLLYRRAEELLAQQSSSIVTQLKAQQALEAQMRDMQSALKAHYQHFDFRTMPSFLGEAPMSVEIIECHLKLNEQKEVEKKESQDQFAQREERLQWVKTPIEFKDLFKKRSLKPKEPEKEINKVLLIGEAGTGKTSLTKKIAHDWSVGNWGQEFTAVYVLPVRALKADKYDNNGHPCRDANLPTAIANECFTGNKAIDGFKKLRRCIEASLNDPGTLVILDGLDEQHGTSEAILREAKSGNYKLLLTSRPYGIEAERSLVDMEVDHMGLDAAQRDNFIGHALSDPTLTTSLISFIQTQNLQEMSSVPVNLKILCTLWKKDRTDLDRPNLSVGLSALYRKLVNHVWDRFAHEIGKQGNHPFARIYRPAATSKKNLFQDLEKIALVSLQQGKIIIDRYSIQEILGDETPSHLLEDAGFLLLQKVDLQYQFPHLTFQEYFTGRRLARQFLSGEQKAVTKFLRQHMYTPRYRRTLSFMSGEIVKGMSSEVGSTASGEELVPIQALLQLAAELPEEILGLQYLVLQLRLLNEWLLIVEDPEEKADTVLSLEAKFHLGNNLITWFNAGLRQYRHGDKSTQVLYTTLMTLLSEAHGVTKHYGTELCKHILNALQDSVSSVRIAALEALPTLVEKGADVQAMLTPILNALQDSVSSVRIAALEALRTLVGKGADVQAMLTPILNALKDSDSDVRIAALEALPTLVEKGADVQAILTPILNALQHRYSDVRSAALQALPPLVEKGADVQAMLTLILNALQHRYSDVRSAALQALRTLVGKGADVQAMLTLILNALQHRYSDVRS